MAAPRMDVDTIMARLDADELDAIVPALQDRVAAGDLAWLVALRRRLSDRGASPPPRRAGFVRAVLDSTVAEYAAATVAVGYVASEPDLHRRAWACVELARVRPVADLIAAAAACEDYPASTDVLARWIQEAVLRRQDVARHAVAQARMDGLPPRHELADLPLTVHADEVGIVDGSPAGPRMLARLRPGDIRREGTPIRPDDVTPPAWRSRFERLLPSELGWQVETKVLRLESRGKVTDLATELLLASDIEAVRDIDALVVSGPPRAVVLHALWTEAARGAFMVAGATPSQARAAAWHAIAGLAGVTARGPDAVTAATRSTSWLMFETRSPWWRDHKLGIVAVRSPPARPGDDAAAPRRHEIAILAATVED